MVTCWDNERERERERKKSRDSRLTRISRRKYRSALIIKLIVNFYTGDHLDASWFFGDSSCATWTEGRWEKRSKQRENVKTWKRAPSQGGNKCPYDILDIVPLSLTLINHSFDLQCHRVVLCYSYANEECEHGIPRYLCCKVSIVFFGRWIMSLALTTLIRTTKELEARTSGCLVRSAGEIGQNWLCIALCYWMMLSCMYSFFVFLKGVQGGLCHLMQATNCIPLW